MEIEQASEQEQRGREDKVVSVLSRLRPPVASDFSMLTTMFGAQQHDALEDYTETSLMLRVNDR